MPSCLYTAAMHLASHSLSVHCCECHLMIYTQTKARGFTTGSKRRYSPCEALVAMTTSLLSRQ